jgi:hypothetical protein
VATASPSSSACLHVSLTAFLLCCISAFLQSRSFVFVCMCPWSPDVYICLHLQLAFLQLHLCISAATFYAFCNYIYAFLQLQLHFCISAATFLQLQMQF